jgi:hypothetical protein
MKSGFFFWGVGGGILPLGVTNKNRASNCTQDFLKEKKITQKLLIFCGGKKKVEIVIFRSYAVACRQHVCQGFKKNIILFFLFLKFSQIWRNLVVDDHRSDATYRTKLKEKKPVTD